MALSATFKYSGKTLDNKYDAWITHHMCVRALMMVGLTSSNAKAMTLTMA
jgi:hypothetical protein